MPNSSNHQHKMPMFKGKAASQNTAQEIALAAPAASAAAVQGRATLYLDCQRSQSQNAGSNQQLLNLVITKAPAEPCKNIMDLQTEVLEKWHEKIKSDTVTKSIPNPRTGF